MKKRIIGLLCLFSLLVSVATAQKETDKFVKKAKLKVKISKPVNVEEGNVPGWNKEIFYIDGNHTHWIVKGVPKSGTILTTGDPIWTASSDNRKTWIFLEWLTILDDQGGLWQSKMHAETMNGKIYVKLENKHVHDSNGKDGQIHILDWSGKKWEIASVGVSDGIVQFNLFKKF